ncbi:MAG: DUF3696 domain-containing protein [Candidatus Omnitrophica bacterium]|nr:DUF3696 domain-containing protein [Candidatus Omnitrophota bacterium]
MIKQLNLKNFKCFENETINFSPLTLLAGLNGMGKSTIFQALLLLRQNYELGLLQDDKGLLLNGELVQIGNAKDLLYQYFESKEISIEIVSEDNAVASWTWKAESDAENLPLEKKSSVDNRIYDCSLFNQNFHYLNAERIGPRIYFETSNYNVINKNNIGLRGEYAANYLSEFQLTKIPIEQLKNQNSTDLTLLEQVNAWLSEIRPGTRIAVTSNLEMGLVGLSYQFISGKDISNKFRPTNVGFGLSYLLPVLVAILSSRPGTLLLFENPEAHLHPQGQVRIGMLMALAAAYGIQVVIETHSDHILNGARVAIKEGIIKPDQTSLLFFTGETVGDKYKHNILKPIIDQNGRIDNWPDGFFDEWEKQLKRIV